MRRSRHRSLTAPMSSSNQKAFAVASRHESQSARAPVPSAPRPAGPGRLKGQARSLATVGRALSLALHSVQSFIFHPLAAAVTHPATRFRLPTFVDLKAVYTDKKLAIPESVIKDRVGQ